VLSRAEEMTVSARVCGLILMWLAVGGASAAQAEGGLAERLEAILGQERQSLDGVPSDRLMVLTDPVSARKLADAGAAAASAKPVGAESGGVEVAAVAAPAAATPGPTAQAPAPAVALTRAATVAAAPGETGAAPAAGADVPPEALVQVSVARAPRGSGTEWQCLTEALYFEARGESLTGVMAVAEVILNRVASPDFPDSVCGVVRQGGEGLYNCQFTYRCDGQAEVIREDAAWDAVGRVASLMLQGAPRNLTEGATHYHTRAVHPSWANRYQRTATIGFHHFYRRPLRTASN